MIIEIIVKTKQKTSKVEKIDDTHYKVSVKSSPIENKANVEVIKILSEYIGISKNRIRIKLGKTSSKKIVEINLMKNNT